MADLYPWPWDDATSRQDILKPFSILIKIEATEYFYLIRFIFQILMLLGSIFDLNEIPDSSHPYTYIQITTGICVLRSAKSRGRNRHNFNILLFGENYL